MKTHNTGTINSSARYCLAKPGDKVRITKTHRAGIRQYAACEEGMAPYTAHRPEYTGGEEEENESIRNAIFGTPGEGGGA